MLLKALLEGERRRVEEVRGIERQGIEELRQRGTGGSQLLRQVRDKSRISPKSGAAGGPSDVPVREANMTDDEREMVFELAAALWEPS